MRNANPPYGHRSAAAACGFLVCVAALTADGTSLDGNLQNQCNDFGASVVKGTSFTISANCNQEGSTSAKATSFDLSGHVSWDTSNQTLGWDKTLSDTVTDIADSCSAEWYEVGFSDVTLALSCSVPGGNPSTTTAKLGLNGNLKVGTDGELSRR